MEYELFIPTCEELVDAKLDFADIKAGDVVFDLGCGDGRVLIAAAQKHRAKGFGVEMRGELVAVARDAVRTQGLEDLIEICEGDYHAADLTEADVVIIYLNRGFLGELSIKLERELRPGARIVTHQFDLPGWLPERQASVQLPDGSEETVYRYRQQLA